MTETPETDTQRATRSALGGFERDAKTFQGHLDKVLVSAEAFVRRHAKFALQEPGHDRLQETVDLLAEAKRINGQDAGTEVPIAVQAQADSDAYADATERVAGIEGAVMMLARLALTDAQHESMGQADHADALSYLRNWLGHLAPLPKREPGDVPRVALESAPHPGTVVASMDARAGVPGYVDAPGATGNFAGWNENVRSGPVTPDPAAGLIQREQERVQAVLDAAAAKANPLAAALAPPAAAVNPFAGWPAPST